MRSAIRSLAADLTLRSSREPMMGTMTAAAIPMISTTTRISTRVNAPAHAGRRETVGTVIDLVIAHLGRWARRTASLRPRFPFSERPLHACHTRMPGLPAGGGGGGLVVDHLDLELAGVQQREHLVG